MKAGRSFPSIVPVLVSFINVIPMYEMGGPSRIYSVSFLPIYCRPFVHTPLSRPLSPLVVCAAPVENPAKNLAVKRALVVH